MQCAADNTLEDRGSVWDNGLEDVGQCRNHWQHLMIVTDMS